MLSVRAPEEPAIVVMQNLELAPEEVEVLQEVLDHERNELDVEIFRTDTHDFKVKLKHRREIVDQIMSRLSALQMAA